MDKKVTLLISSLLLAGQAWATPINLSGSEQNLQQVFDGITVGGDSSVDVVNDQIGSPTYVGDLVAALLQIADQPISAPILHAANTDDGSRFDQAAAVYAIVGADQGLVRPVSSAGHPRPAARPSYSALGARLSEAVGLTPSPPWRQALVRALSGS